MSTPDLVSKKKCSNPVARHRLPTFGSCLDLSHGRSAYLAVHGEPGSAVVWCINRLATPRGGTNEGADRRLREACPHNLTAGL